MYGVRMNTHGTVLVTGASSGIGREAALHLNEIGYTVIGTVRHPGDADALRSASARPDAMHPELCDVTSPEQVAALRDRVQEVSAATGLTAMFSNAGVANMRGDVSAEGCPVDTLDQLIQVNYLGSVRVIQTHLPLLRASRGTLVINSALMTHTVLPFNGGYAPSKAALETWADGLRREIRPHGVRVVVIRAAAISSPLLEAKQDASSVPDDGPYPQQRAFIVGTLHMEEKIRGWRSTQPARVADLVARVINRRRPPLKPIMGGGSRAIWLVGLLPERVQDAVIATMIHRIARTAPPPGA